MSEMIDLTKLSTPEILEELDFEVLLANRKAKFLSLLTDSEQNIWQHRLNYESDPVVKLLEENCYLEMLVRKRINNALQAVMLAYATGSNLEHLGALFGVQRLILAEATEDTEAVYEDDDRLRKRIQMSLEGITTAGPIGSYEYHALTASAKVKDVNVVSPRAGDVLVTLLSTEANGIASSELIETVKVALNAEHVRPLCDTVIVQSAEVLEYQISATLSLFPSVLQSMVFVKAEKTINSYVSNQHRLGRDITLSGIYAALHQEGVQNVKITSPMADLVVTPQQVAYCTGITLKMGGIDE